MIIVYWAWGILRESAIILLEMAPRGMNVDTISCDLKNKFSEIEKLNNVHVWTITASMRVFSAHIRFSDKVRLCADHNKLILTINKYLHEKYNIMESTIQLTSEDKAEVCELPQA